MANLSDHGFNFLYSLSILYSILNTDALCVVLFQILGTFHFWIRLNVVKLCWAEAGRRNG